MHTTRNCLCTYIFATKGLIGMKISALERTHKGEFLYDIRKDEHLPMSVFVQYKDTTKASYLLFSQLSPDFLQICHTVT